MLLHIHLLENEGEARKLAKELHSATHLGGQSLWKLFRDRYVYKAGRRICLEVAQAFPVSDGVVIMATVRRRRSHPVQRTVGHTIDQHCGTSPR